MNVFAGLGEELRERPGHNYTESLKQGHRKRRTLKGRPAYLDLPVIPNPWKLTPSQCAVLRLMVDGQDQKTIADALAVKVNTVEQHIYMLKKKMGQSSRIVACIEWDRFIKGRPNDAQ